MSALPPRNAVFEAQNCSPNSLDAKLAGELELRPLRLLELHRDGEVESAVLCENGG